MGFDHAPAGAALVGDVDVAVLDVVDVVDVLDEAVVVDLVEVVEVVELPPVPPHAARPNAKATRAAAAAPRRAPWRTRSEPAGRSPRQRDDATTYRAR